MKRIVGVPCPGRLAQWMPAPPVLILCMPQTVPPLRQPCPEQPAMPTSKQYNSQRSPWGGESFLTPPQIKPPPWASPIHRTMEDLAQEGGEAVADLSFTQEVYWGRGVCSHHIRRVICPLGQCPVSHHHHQHLKEPSLSGEVSQGPPSMIP